MDFLKGLLKNLAFLLAIGVVLFFLFPNQISQVFQLYGAIFGPIAILILIVAAMPRKKR
jgi:peptidoglycan/LPS O-acetylase OafA/YrhL